MLSFFVTHQAVENITKISSVTFKFANCYEIILERRNNITLPRVRFTGNLYNVDVSRVPEINRPP